MYHILIICLSVEGHSLYRCGFVGVDMELLEEVFHWDGLGGFKMPHKAQFPLILLPVNQHVALSYCSSTDLHATMVPDMMVMH